MTDKIDKTDKNLKSKYKWIEKGKNVWVTKVSTDPQDIFLQAKVLEINQKIHKITIQLISNKKVYDVSLQNCLKLTYGENDVSDMVDLQELNEPQLLYNIKRRYQNDMIFTFCGPTLLIINPYRKIEKLLQESVLHQYQILVFADTLEYKSQPPHIYGLAGFCLWQLFDNNRNQSIVISGESGAGKTQNTKFCLSFLASLGKNMKEFLNIQKSNKINANLARMAEKAIKKSNNKLNGIEDRILGCNQILEAFGNSKTIRNDNSSRFGKLIILLYGETQIDIKSAFITNYLLEKSRIVSLSDGQRNYHIFYYFCKGSSPQQKLRYRLSEPMTSYYFLNQSTVYNAGGSDPLADQKQFSIIKKEFEAYLTEDEIVCVLSIVSAVLNLGNIKFVQRQNQEVVQIEKDVYLKNVAFLINANYDQLVHAFRFKTRKLAGAMVDSPLKLDEALALRDSFAKNLYEKLFNFLVFKLNDKIQLQKLDIEELSVNRQNRKSIGILDIFGFQILARNSLEQFFINFANEKLQQLYVSYIFKEQQNQFFKEGLKDHAYELDFEDNKPIIDLIQSYPSGIFHMINDSSELNKADSALPQQIVKQHKNNLVTIPKSKPQYFYINHSCSPVEYYVIGFTSKNKDQFPAQMLSIVNKIQNVNMKTIINFEADKNEGAKGKASKKFLGTKFLQQMNKLIDQLCSCDCHFVRCIKPNDKKTPRLFYSSSVLQSLRNLGVLDSIRIRKLGYVYRRPFKQFYKKFYEIQAYNYNFNSRMAKFTEEDFREISKKFVVRFANKEYENNFILFGTKKILIKEASLNNLQSLAKQKRRLRISAANKFRDAYSAGKFRQGTANFFKAFKVFKGCLINFKKQIQKKIKIKKTIKIQRGIRKFLIDIRYKKIAVLASKSAVIIGAYWRMVLQRRKYNKMKKNLLVLQSNMRKYLTVCKFYKLKMGKHIFNQILDITWKRIQTISATKIQKLFRGWRTRLEFKDLIKQIQQAKIKAVLNIKSTKIQKWWRYKMFKKSLMKYRNAASLIQAHWKRRLIQRVYKKVLASTKLIQKAVKKHLNKRYYISQQWSKYINNIEQFEQLRKVQLDSLRLSPKEVRQCKKYFEESSNRIQVASPAETMKKYLIESANKLEFIKKTQNQIVNSSLNSTDKNDFQSYILDFDLLTNVSQFYDQWNQGYKAVLLDIKSKYDYPVRIDLNESFTIVTSQKQKIYCFGQIHPNDKLFTNVEVDEPYKITLSTNSAYLINTNRKLYTWGDNYDEQLMLGHSDMVYKVTENAFIPMEKIKDIQSKGEDKYLLSNSGKVYEYKRRDNRNQSLYSLKNQLLPNIEIKLISASYSFVHFLSRQGYLYSKGNNSQGQLGLGHNNKFIHNPELNKYFKDNKHIIDEISAGFKHSSCRTRLGYAYIWGENSFKQVSSTDQNFFNSPQLIEVDKPANKCLHVICGFRSSMILLQNFKIYTWGTNTSLSFNGYSRVEYQKLFETNLIPLKISAAWSRTMSIFYMNGLSINKCKRNINRQLINKTIKILSKQWNLNTILPPYIEQAQTNLNLSDLKKFKFKPRELRDALNVQSVGSSNKIQEMALLVELRKNSSTFNLTAKQKFHEILNSLMAKDLQQWSEQDKKMYQYLQNPKIQQLLKKL